MAFIDKALSLVKKDGRVLIGDIANVSKKERFLNSARGKKFQEEWDSQRQDTTENDDLTDFQNGPPPMIMDDAFVLKLLSYVRSKGFNAYLLDQAQSLPFGNTREDLLIVGPEYQDS